MLRDADASDRIAQGPGRCVIVEAAYLGAHPTTHVCDVQATPRLQLQEN
jgi:hypothetical protein